MRTINLFAITALLTIAFNTEASDTDEELNTSKDSQQTTGRPGGSSTFGCNPFPECEEETSSIWLDLLIQQFQSQQQSENKKGTH